MAFRIAARTILELGAELISSDGIAIYELIKNAIDAGSRRVRIDVQVAIPRSLYNTLVEEIDTHPGPSSTLKATLLQSLEEVEPSRRDALAASLEALQTGGDIAAALAAWYAEHNFIAVRDTGHGMNLDDLNEVYLTVGTRSRLRDKALPRAAGSRPPLGEKGVGRLSTMRLGESLLVETSKAGEKDTSELFIDWNAFSHASDAMLEDVHVEPRRGKPKPDASKSGTVVTVRGLRSDWDRRKLETIAREEFAKLVDPWAGDTANRIIRLTFNGEHVAIPEIERQYLELAHGHCEAALEFQEGMPVLRGRVEYRLRKKEKTFRLGAAEILSSAGGASLAALRSVGPFDMEMWWFNRILIAGQEGLGTKKEILEKIGQWSGGLMLFRDGFRVNPYGSGEDDWLELDRRAFASKGYKLNRQQVVGRVRISWENRGLQDQTNREGLVSTPEKHVLTALLRHILLGEFKTFIEAEDKAARVQERTTLETVAERIESAQDEVADKLRRIEEVLPKEHRALAKQTSSVVKELSVYVDEAKELGEEYVRDRAQLVYLAGIGLMVEFILHELDRATSGTLATLKGVSAGKLDRETTASLSVLKDQLETLNKRVANLDVLGTTRRQVKTNFDVKQTIARIVDGRAGEARRRGMQVGGSYADPGSWTIRGVPGMFLQIIENLAANSFYWLARQVEVENGFIPRLTIDTDPAGGTVTVTDNGPGIDPTMAESIFEPFVTRKPAGEGRGLGLYISREVATNQGWRLDLVREPTVRPDRYNTFVLELAGKSVR
ncbi:ATP-binding protein [Methylobacterium sp. A49B]